MRKKSFHKNSKKAIRKSPKPSIKRGIRKERFLLLDKFFLFFYLAVGFFPHMNTLDVAVSQWYYISILNVVAIGYLLFYKNYIQLNFHSKFSLAIFTGTGAFLIISIISILKSISVSESIVFMVILLNTILALFIIYSILKDKLRELFPFISGVLMLFLVIESLQIIHHFGILNSAEPRSVEIFQGLNPTYGNRNIFAAALIVKMSFTFFVLFNIKDVFLRVVSFAVIFCSVLSILLIGARTAIFSLPIIFLILLVGYYIIHRKSGVQPFLKRILAPLLLVFVLAFVSSLSFNRIHREKLNTFDDLVFTKSKKDLYRDNAKKNSLASDSGRKEFWEAAINGFKSSPIIGVGIGNWKIIEKDRLVYSKKGSNHFYPRRAHNDFLQVLSEMGIIGFVLFILFFATVFYVLIRVVFLQKDQVDRLIALVCISGFTAYTLDSLINFPSERTPIQILGFLIVAITISLTSKQKELKISRKHVQIPIAILGVILVYFTNQIYVSAKYQMIVRNNIRGTNILKDTYKVGYHQMNELYPKMIKLNFMGQPIDYAKAVLAYSEGKYDLAMKHLNLAIQESPYTLEHYSFKSLIFRSNSKYKNQDSAVYYAKKVFDKRPGLINQYNILKRHYKSEKDTAALFDIIMRHTSFVPQNENAWIDKINYYLKYEKDLPRAKELIDSAKLMIPDSKRIADLRIVNNSINSGEVINASDSTRLKRIELQNVLNQASKLFSQRKYNEAYQQFEKGLKMAPSNEEIRLSLALTDIKLKKYKAAIDKLDAVILSNKVTNGKPEYNRGLCYLRLNNKKAAGIDFRASYAKGFSMAKQLDPKILKY
jgi:O-antigen ligase/tetratricopeptide (TPR) repeat protein